MVREPHRLRALQVRVAGQHRVEVLARALEQHAAQLREPALRRVRRVAQVEREVGRDLVVAAAPGVQRPATGPICSRSRASTFMWMSSSAGSNGKLAALDLAERSPRGPATQRRPSSAADTIPRCPSMRAWAIDPRMS